MEGRTEEMDGWIEERIEGRKEREGEGRVAKWVHGWVDDGSNEEGRKSSMRSSKLEHPCRVIPN